MRLASMPTWGYARGKGMGRGAIGLHWKHRVAIHALHALQVPSSAVGKSIVTVVKATAPWLSPVEPTASSLRYLRFEGGIVEELCACWRIASAYRVRQLGSDETTKFQDPSMVVAVLIEPTKGAPLEVNRSLILYVL